MKNKKVISLVIVIILIFGVAPYFVGNTARENIEKQAVLISQTPGYSLNIREYDQGWFTSRAVIAYGFDEHTLNILGKSEKKEDDKEIFNVLKDGFVFEVNIAHGPVTFQNGVNFAIMTMTGKLQDINHEAFRKIKEASKTDSFLNLFASVSYGGTTNIDMQSPSLKIDYSDIAGQKMIIDYSGMDMQATLNAALDEYNIHFNLDQLKMNLADADIIFKKMVISANGTKINDYLWLGSGETNAGEFTISNPKAKAMTMSFIDFDSEYSLLKESEDALTMNWKSDGRKIMASGVELENFKLDLDINHLDIAAITDYAKSIQESYQTADGKTPTPEEIAAKTQVIAIRVGEQIIKKSPELVINSLSFTMGEGYYKSDGTLSINGKGLENIQQLSDPIALNKRLAVLVNIDFNKALAKAITAIAMKKQMAAGGVDVATMPPEQLDQMIDVQSSAALQSFVNQGYFIQDGEKYTTSFRMKDGQRLINGKPLPIPGM